MRAVRCRAKTSWACIVVVLVASFPACGADEKTAARDFDVLETVLKDLLSSKESPLEGMRVPEAERRIRLFVEAGQRDFYSREISIDISRALPDTVYRGRARWIAQSVDDHVRRSARKNSFEAFRPTDHRIILTEQANEPTTNSVYRRRRQVFLAYPPGYSRDGELAIVRMTFPWSIHSGYVVYVLSKENEGWRVLGSQVVIHF
jgi:hypothetical protein